MILTLRSANSEEMLLSFSFSLTMSEPGCASPLPGSVVGTLGVPTNPPRPAEPVPLSGAETDLLRKEIRKDFASAENNLSEEELSLKVEAALPLAMVQKRAYDKAIKAFNMNFEQSKNLALTIKRYLEASQKLPEGNMSAKSELRRADMALKRFTGDIEVKLNAANEEANLAWFGETVVQTLAKLSQVQEQFDNLKIDYEMEVSRHGFGEKSESSKPNEAKPTEVIKAEPAQLIGIKQKPPAKKYDVHKVIPRKFSGKSIGKSVHQDFIAWKSRWMQVKVDLETKCDGVSDDILFEKLKNCLDGRALVLANAATSYGDALEVLSKTYEDKFEHLVALLQGLKSDMDVISHQQSGKKALCLIEELVDEFAKEGVSPEDFLGIHLVCKSMAPSTLNGWCAYVLKCKEEHIERHKQANDLKDNPWKLGYAINRIGFNSWYEKWAMDNKGKDMKEDAGSVPASEKGKAKNKKAKARLNAETQGEGPKMRDTKTLSEKAHEGRDKGRTTTQLKSDVSTTQTDCIFHHDGSHPLSRCKVVLGMSRSQWVKACKTASKCPRCLDSWVPGHQKLCSELCSLCQGEHHSVNCEMNKARQKFLSSPRINAPGNTPRMNTPGNAYPPKTNEMSSIYTSAGETSYGGHPSRFVDMSQRHKPQPPTYTRYDGTVQFQEQKEMDKYYTTTEYQRRTDMQQQLHTMEDSMREETRKRPNTSLPAMESSKRMRAMLQSYKASKGNHHNLSSSVPDPNKARELAMTPLQLLKLYTLQNRKISYENGMVVFEYASFPKETKTNFKMTRHNELDTQFYTLDSLVNFVAHMHKSHSDYVYDAMHFRNVMIVRQQDRQNLIDYITGKINTCSNIVQLTHFQLNPGQSSSHASGSGGTYSDRKNSSHSNLEEWQEWSNTSYRERQLTDSRVPASSRYNLRSDYENPTQDSRSRNSDALSYDEMKRVYERDLNYGPGIHKSHDSHQSGMGDYKSSNNPEDPYIKW